MRVNERYEYKLLLKKAPGLSEEQLNDLGNDGWLLQTIYPHPEEDGVVYVFSRIIAEDK